MVLRPLKVQLRHIWIKKFKRIILGWLPRGLEKIKALDLGSRDFCL